MLWMATSLAAQQPEDGPTAAESLPAVANELGAPGAKDVDDADSLLREAVDAYTRSLTAEPAERLRLVAEAIDKLDEIQDRFPDSDVAFSIAVGQEVEGLTYPRLRAELDAGLAPETAEPEVAPQEAASEPDASPPTNPNRLFVEAAGLFRQAEASEDAGTRLRLLEEGLAKLDAIVEEHPESDLATMLEGDQPIGVIRRSAILARIDEVRAEQLLRQALQLTARANVAQPDEALEALRKAVAVLDQIIERHPATDLAMRLASGQPVLGLGLTVLEARVLELEAERCRMAPDPGCLLRLARQYHVSDAALSRLQTALDGEEDVGAGAALISQFLSAHLMADSEGSMEGVEAIERFFMDYVQSEAAGMMQAKLFEAITTGIRAVAHARRGEVSEAKAGFARARALVTEPAPENTLELELGRAALLIQIAADEARVGLSAGALESLDALQDFELPEELWEALELYAMTLVTSGFAEAGLKSESRDMAALLLERIEAVQDPLHRSATMILLAQALRQSEAPLLPSPLVAMNLVLAAAAYGLE